MKKKVNGKIVDINNTDLFEAAFEGAILNKKASSAIKDTLDNQSELVKKCIELYYEYDKALPFPLSSVEICVKYAAIGKYIEHNLKDVKVFVRDCMYIPIENNKVLKLMHKTWAIETIKEPFTDDERASLDDFSDMLGYEEFKWSLEKMKTTKELDDYYKVFMPEFLEACKDEPMILKWELQNILNFGYVPKQLNISDNRLVDISNDYEYFLDVFSTGKKESNESLLEITVRNGKSSVENKKKLVKVYNFEVYGKAKGSGVLDRKEENKIEKKKVDGMAAVFETIVKAGTLQDRVEKVSYRGFISDNVIIFEVESNLYACIFDKYSKATPIANKVKIFAYENNRIYMKKETKSDFGATREVIYSYDLVSSKARICRISFRK